ncbi:MAG TPA: Amuc_1100 family pilus-like protein [Chthoniobacterales bacterium]|nr:Amuc_1100 family pilus-like protein [Chthoniobacterales bacterium]
MNWYRENRWLGNFLIAFAGAVLLVLWFLFHANGGFAEASAQFSAAATERNRLEHLNPFPNEENFRKTQAALDNYGATLNKLKEELRAQMVPIAPLAPNEFQSRLRQAIVSTTEKARANRVKLPENFHLGFDEFTTTLPTTAAAPLLAQELGQVELLLGILVDARVDGIATLKRATLPPETAPATAPAARKPSGPANAAPATVERAIVDLTFTASPSAIRKVLNQIGSSERQFFIVRTLSVRNEQLKGPSREQSNAAVATATQPTSAIKFIVGNEHVETTATIEMVRFAF